MLHAGIHASGMAGQHFELFDSIFYTAKQATTHKHSFTRTVCHVMPTVRHTNNGILATVSSVNPIPSFIRFRSDTPEHTPTDPLVWRRNVLSAFLVMFSLNQASGANKVTDHVCCVFSS